AKAVEEIFRVLRRGGRVTLMFYHRNSALYRLTLPYLSVVTGKTVRQLEHEVYRKLNTILKLYSKDEIKQ
ncbi:MAG: hypothetical protein V3T61_00430, partial [Acidobacteriota bacterium]